MSKEKFEKAKEDMELDECVTYDNDGEPVQDEWAYDRFKAGATWAYNWLEAEMEEISAENSTVIELLEDLVYAPDAQTFSEARVKAEDYLKTKLELSCADAELFTDVLTNPTKPNKELKKAYKGKIK